MTPLLFGNKVKKNSQNSSTISMDCITTYSSRWIKKIVTFHSWTLIYTENQMAFLVTTNLYLHHNSHHHPSHKQSMLTSLIHRATAICDQDSTNQELEFLTTMFRNNGYGTQQICRAMKPPTNTTKMDKPTSMAYIPFMQTTYGRLSRMLTEHNIKCIPLPLKKIFNYLPPIKDAVGLRTPNTYSIPCECGKVYIGQSSRSVHI
jgi:hypothetical protein